MEFNQKEHKFNTILENEEEENSLMYIDTSKIKTTKLDNTTTKNSSKEDRNQTVFNENENEVDDVSELKEKFKQILEKIPRKTGEENLIYGMNVNLLSDKKKITNGIIYCNDEKYIKFLKPGSKSEDPKLQILLTSISDMTVGNSGIFKSLSFPLSKDCCLTVNYSNNFSHFNLIFKTNSDLEIFICGIIAFLLKKVDDNNIYDTDLLMLKRIWKEIDPGHSKYLDLDQFSEFLRKINYDLKGKTPEQIFKEKAKTEGKIKFKDFIYFYEELVTGEEFKAVFDKYSYSPNKDSFSVASLKEFMKNEQSENITIEEALKIINKYSKKAKKYNLSIANNSNNSNSKNISTTVNKTGSMTIDYENHSFGRSQNTFQNNLQSINMNLNINLNLNLNSDVFKLSFREFMNFLIDKANNNIIDQSEISICQNMNEPLTNYYCNSSHNTYLSGNQVSGETSLDMYRFVMKDGVRFIDLDTYDGPDDEPIITHWHYPVGQINFRDTLIAIRETAFIKSEFPVILSLENHCSAPYQKKMEIYFLEILGRDNLYILDNDNPPIYYPSPNQLKRKYIIKNKRKRLLGKLNESNNNGSVSVNVNSFPVVNTSNVLESTCQLSNVNVNSHSDNVITNEECTICTSTKNNDINNNNTSLISEKGVNNSYKTKKIMEKFTQAVIPEEELSNKDSTDSEIEEGDLDIPSVENPNLTDIKLINNLNSNELIPSDHFEINFDSSNKINVENCISLSIYPHKHLQRKLSSSSLQKNTDIDLVPFQSVSSNILKKKKETYEQKEKEDQEKSQKEWIDQIRKDDQDYPSAVQVITVDSLANILGLVGVKYHQETFTRLKFLPWECISIAEPDLLKYIANFNGKNKIIKYCQKSFLKVYPGQLRINSSNYCPVYFWSLGCQFAALNLQKRDEDSILINKMFFKLNGGKKCGYVLKPLYLRKNLPLKLSYKIEFEVLSGFHLNLCYSGQTNISGMYIEVSFKGPNPNSEYQEKPQNKLVTKYINNNFLHPIWLSTNSVCFDVYEPELSFIIVKLLAKSTNNVLARAAIPIKNISYGYRVLELYDKECSKFEESYLIVKSTKI